MTGLVLIVDANAKRLETTQRLIERTGAVTVPATNSLEAMVLFVRRQPLVTVIQVDTWNQIDLILCRDMKALKMGVRRAVVAVGPRDLRSAAFEIGCDAFVARENDLLPLGRVVRSLLAARRKRSADLGLELIS